MTKSSDTFIFDLVPIEFILSLLTNKQKQTGSFIAVDEGQQSQIVLAKDCKEDC